MPYSATDIPNQQGKVAIVTGANSGIGFETAVALAKKGAQVVMASRSLPKAWAARDEILKVYPHGLIDVMKLDLADFTSIFAFATEFKNKFSQLNLLVNNAGIMLPPFGKTPQAFELTFATNHLGPFLLTGLLMENLAIARGSRVVTVSSLAHRQGKIVQDNLNAERHYSKTAAYAQSKLANLLFTFELERRLRQRQVETIAVAAHPGWTLTNLQVNTKIFTFLNPFFGQKPSDGALPTLYAATAHDIKGADYYGPQGLLELKGPPKKVHSTKLAQDLVLARQLWEISEKMTGITYFS